MTRLWALIGMFAVLSCVSHAALAGRTLASNATASAVMLKAVKNWGVQLQNVDPRAIAQLNTLDLVAIEPMVDAAAGIALTPAQVLAMKRKSDGSRRLVIAYLSVGEAASYRPYWQQDWQRQPPPWLGTTNPNWPGAHGVHFWEPAWQRIVFDAPASMLDDIIKAGFDGVFLDRIDAYRDWEGQRPTAAQDMIDMVSKLAAKARFLSPEFLVVGQNSEALLANNAYMAAIDAVSKESLLFGVNGEAVENSGEQIAWSLGPLLAAKGAGLPVLAIEYLGDPSQQTRARERLREHGFVPFIGNRLLDRTPIVP